MSPVPLEATEEARYQSTVEKIAGELLILAEDLNLPHEIADGLGQHAP